LVRAVVRLNPRVSLLASLIRSPRSLDRLFVFDEQARFPLATDYVSYILTDQHETALLNFANILWMAVLRIR
jgi:hypothetical protein